MDPLDALLERPSVVGRSLSLLVRNPPPEQAPEILDAACRLLGRRRQADEIVMLVATPPPVWPAARLGARGIRMLVRSDAASGAALGWAFKACRAPLLVLWDGRSELDPATLSGLLESLQSADAAFLRRSKRGGFDFGYGLFGYAARHYFGVPVPDPGAPLRAFRRAAVAGISLRSHGELADFELAAKLTSLTTLLADDIVSDDPPPKEGRLGRTLWRERAGLRRLAGETVFWNAAPRPALANPETVAEPTVPVVVPRRCGRRSILSRPNPLERRLKK